MLPIIASKQPLEAAAGALQAAPDPPATQVPPPAPSSTGPSAPTTTPWARTTAPATSVWRQHSRASEYSDLLSASRSMTAAMLCASTVAASRLLAVSLPGWRRAATLHQPGMCGNSVSPLSCTCRCPAGFALSTTYPIICSAPCPGNMTNSTCSSCGSIARINAKGEHAHALHA
jgi:hypothetical protein